MTLRLCGHAVYDKGDYMPAEQMREMACPRPGAGPARKRLLDMGGLTEAGVAAIEQAIEEELRAALALAMPVRRPDPDNHHLSVFADALPAATASSRRRGRPTR